MADKTVRVYDKLHDEYIDIRVRDNGDGTYSQDVKNNPLPLVNTIDSVAAYDASDYVIVNGVALTPKTAIANIAASQTDANVVSAVSGKKIRILQLAARCGSIATNATFNSKGGGAGAAISPTFQNAANDGPVLPYSKVGWFDTNSGEALTVTTGSGSTTNILIKYIEVP